MKTLYLGRHGKSSWDEAGLADHQRPLIPRGEHKTSLVAAYLSREGVKPDLIVASHAVRSRETARIIARILEYPENEIQTERRIYDGPYYRILDFISETDQKISSLMLVGHNPLITQTLNHLSSEAAIDYMPTSAMAGLVFDGPQWSDILVSKGRQKFYIFPKLLY